MNLIRVLFFLGLTPQLFGLGCVPEDDQMAESPKAERLESHEWSTVRSAQNPLLTTDSPGMVAEHGYPNVNGPSVIRVPGWVVEPLGRYYMYFAHHRGSFIRLAYADSVEGPWTVSERRVLVLDEAPALDHVASPDVHVDTGGRKIRMYYHSVDDTTGWIQTTYMAESTDGLEFESLPQPLGPPYMRVFQGESDSTWWAVAKIRGGPGGILLRSSVSAGPFEEGPVFLPGMRHAGVLTEGDLAHVFFSRIGDEPERLLVATIDPSRLWAGADVGDVNIQEVLRPETTYEGADLPVAQSAIGEADQPVHALRDPAIFTEANRSRIYLFYSIAGENGIAVAELGR